MDKLTGETIDNALLCVNSELDFERDTLDFGLDNRDGLESPLTALCRGASVIADARFLSPSIAPSHDRRCHRIAVAGIRESLAVPAVG
jgi:hypothetical protein